MTVIYLLCREWQHYWNPTTNKKTCRDLLRKSKLQDQPLKIISGDSTAEESIIASSFMTIKQIFEMFTLIYIGLTFLLALMT